MLQYVNDLSIITYNIENNIQQTWLSERKKKISMYKVGVLYDTIKKKKKMSNDPRCKCPRYCSPSLPLTILVS